MYLNLKTIKSKQIFDHQAKHQKVEKIKIEKRQQILEK